MQDKANRGIAHFVRRVAVSGVVATAVSWIVAGSAHVGFADNHNETLVRRSVGDRG